METIIVTGGAGYIGSHTILELLDKTDLNIISIDNFSNASSETFERIKRITGKTIQNYNVDLRDINQTESVFKEHPSISGIIHFAAFKSVPESIADPFKYYVNNVSGLNNLLQLCRKYSVPRFIFSSSCSVYGNIEHLPVNELTPLGRAESPYARTKQVGEILLKDHTINYPDLKIIALRYFNPVGSHKSGLIGELPLNKPSSLFSVITQTAIGKNKQMMVFGDDYNTRDGSCIRDYIHVTDIANAHIKAFQKLITTDAAGFSVYNLGSGRGVSVFEAIHAFEKIAQKKLNYQITAKRLGDVEAIYSDTSLSENELGWKALISLDDTIESAWKWEQYLNNENNS